MGKAKMHLKIARNITIGGFKKSKPLTLGLSRMTTCVYFLFTSSAEGMASSGKNTVGQGPGVEECLRRVEYLMSP